MLGLEGWLSDFAELSNDRPVISTQAGVYFGPIPASSIARHVQGWGQFRAEAFKRAIRAMEAARERKEASPQEDKGAVRNVSARTMTPELFDVVFG